MTSKQMIGAAMLAAVFAVCGCAKQAPSAETAEELTEESAQIAADETGPEETVEASVTEEAETEAADDAEEEVVFAEPPRLVVVPKKTAENVYCEGLVLADEAQYPALQEALNVMNAAVERLSTENAAMFAAEESGEVTPYDRRSVEIKRADGVVLSVLLLSENYNGGEHPYSHVSSANYLTADGTKLTLDDVITSVDALPELLCGKLEAAYPTAYLTDTKTLFESYASDGGDMFVWTLSGEGITFWFEPGLIASYDDGMLSATVRYAEEPTLFDARFSRVPAVFVTEIGENEREGSASGDIAIRSVPSDTIDGCDSLAVSVGGNTLLDELTTKGGSLRAYILHDEDGIRLLAETRADAYHASLRLYDLTNGTPKLLQSLPGAGLAYSMTPEGYGREVPGDPKVFDAAEPLNLLGMTVGTRTFVLAEDGFMRTYDVGYTVSAFDDNGFERVLTLLEPLEAAVYDRSTGEVGEVVELQKETVLHYSYAFSDGRLVMTLNDGTAVVITTDAENGTVYADSVGGIPAETLFAGVVTEETAEDAAEEVEQDV